METLAPGKYFGNTLRSKSIHGIILTEKVHCAGEYIAQHAHENTYICTILEGCWDKRINKQNILCSPLKSIYHLSFEEHADKFIQKSRVFDIEIDHSWHDHFKNRSNSCSSREYYNNEVNWITAKIYYEFINNRNDSDLLFEGLVLELMTKVLYNKSTFKKETTIPNWLLHVKEMIDENFDKSISFKELSRESEVHPVHLSRTFKLFYNYTLGEYQRVVRIKRACEKLILTDLPLLDICIQTGFYDQSHFYRVFKNKVGLLPNSFRKLYKR